MRLREPARLLAIGLAVVTAGCDVWEMLHEKSGVIAIEVVDDRGDGVANATVRLACANASGGICYVSRLTDDDGRARFSGLATGPRVVELVRLRSRETVARPVDVVEGETVTVTFQVTKVD